MGYTFTQLKKTELEAIKDSPAAKFVKEAYEQDPNYKCRCDGGRGRCSACWDESDDN